MTAETYSWNGIHRIDKRKITTNRDTITRTNKDVQRMDTATYGHTKKSTTTREDEDELDTAIQTRYMGKQH
jgi:hypothetical protein